MESYTIDPGVRALGVAFQAAVVHGVTTRKKDPRVDTARRQAARIAAGIDSATHPILRGYQDLFAAVGATDAGAVASPRGSSV